MSPWVKAEYIGGMGLGGGYLDQRFQLSDPLLDFVLNKGFRVLLGADCCSQVGPTFVGDVHTGTRETGLGGGQMMFFGNEPCLGCIGKVAKGRAEGGEPIPPFA